MVSRHIRWVTLAVGVTLAVAVSANVAAGQSLAGETFFGAFGPGPGVPPENTVTSNCNPDGTSTIAFRTSGTALGPYPGTFEESGTITVGPQTGASFTDPTLQFLAFGASAGPVLTFDARFTIFSGETTVAGTKRETVYLENPNVGLCVEASQPGQGPFFGCTVFGAPSLSVKARLVQSHLEYDATINSPAGTTRDRGIASARLINTEVRSALGGCSVRGFREEFLVSTADTTPATVTLEPATATNPVGTRHTVTATVRNAAGEPVSGSEVLFETEGAVSASGSCRTNQEGRCSFSFEGPTFPGEVVITGCADANENNQRDPGEPCGSASKTYVLPVSTPGLTTGGGQILHLTETGVTFGLTFQSDDNGLKGECNVVDHPSGEQKLDCLDVLAYVQSGNEATIYGNATIDGQPAGLYRLHLVDNGESGIGKDVFELETQSGYVRAGTLTQGDVQVHAAG